MKVFHRLDDWFQERELISSSLGLVPTMGALHRAHERLVEMSLKENEKTVVWIFVNPTQFDDPLDFKRYPRRLEEDLDLLKKLNVDYVLAPEEQEIYPQGYRFQISENDLSKRLVGALRPGFFEGVLTVVMKLFNLVRPSRAYFGEKDFQQLLLVEEMVKEFFLKIEIRRLPTVREGDLLPFSSRNKLLSTQGRELASHFPRLLRSEASDEEIKQSLESLGIAVNYIQTWSGKRFGSITIDHVQLFDHFDPAAESGAKN